MNPETKRTPEAPEAAKAELEQMGPMSGGEWLTTVVFIFMIMGWALSGTFGIDKAAIAFLGLAVLMLGRVYTMADLKTEGAAAAGWRRRH